MRIRVLANLRNVDDTLAERVANGLGEQLPPKSAAAVEPKDMALSPALRIVGKYPPSLNGRAVGILVCDGADGADIAAVRSAVEDEGGTVKIIAAKVGGVALKDGTRLKVDGQLAGTPAVLFDAVAIVLSRDGCSALLNEAAAIEFARDAFGHLKAIGFTAEAKPLLDKAGILADAGIVNLNGGIVSFIKSARTRQWDREAKVRTLA